MSRKNENEAEFVETVTISLERYEELQEAKAELDRLKSGITWDIAKQDQARNVTYLAVEINADILTEDLERQARNDIYGSSTIFGKLPAPTTAPAVKIMGYRITRDEITPRIIGEVIERGDKK